MFQKFVREFFVRSWSSLYYTVSWNIFLVQSVWGPVHTNAFSKRSVFTENASKAPRPHHFRRVFAVHTTTKWSAHEIDVNDVSIFAVHTTTYSDLRMK